MLNKKSCTLSATGDGLYNVLIQDENGRILSYIRRVSFERAMKEIEANLGKEADNA